MTAFGWRCWVAALLLGTMSAATLEAQPPAPPPGMDIPVPPHRRDPAPLDPALGVNRAPAVSVEIENRSKQPFEYQMLRAAGSAWTKTYELPEQKLHRYTAPGNSHSPLAMLDNYGAPGFVMIRYSLGGGWVMQKLIAGNVYSYVDHPNGFGMVVESRNEVMPALRPETLALRRLQFERNHCWLPKKNSP